MRTHSGIILLTGLAVTGLALHYTAALSLSIAPLLFLALGIGLGFLLAKAREENRRPAPTTEAEEADRSTHDPVTQAYTRRHMEKVLAQFWDLARQGEAPFSLLLLDIDNFRTINARFGHDVGDRVLQSIVHNIQGNTRKTDMVFRSGADRFLLLLPMTRGEFALSLANRLREEFSKLTFRGPARETFKADFSVGVMEYRGDLAGLEEMTRRLEGALLQAKKENGRISMAS